MFISIKAMAQGLTMKSLVESFGTFQYHNFSCKSPMHGSLSYYVHKHQGYGIMGIGIYWRISGVSCVVKVGKRSLYFKSGFSINAPVSEIDLTFIYFRLWQTVWSLDVMWCDGPIVMTIYQYSASVLVYSSSKVSYHIMWNTEMVVTNAILISTCSMWHIVNI